NAIERASLEGVGDISSDDSLGQVAAKVKAHRQKAASSTLDLYQAQLQAAQENQRSRMNSALDALNTTTMGTPEQRRRALELTLTDAAVMKMLPSTVIKQLRDILSKQQDPAKAVDQVVENLQDKGTLLFGWLPGVHTPGTWKDRAQTFFQ